MSLFEDIKKGFGTAVNYASEKTDEIADIVNLKMSIASAEKKLRHKYEEIGMIYYDTYRSGRSNEKQIEKKVHDIDGLKTEIAKLKGDLAKAQKKNLCPSCGTAIDKDDIFCPVCGAKQGAEADAAESDGE